MSETSSTTGKRGCSCGNETLVYKLSQICTRIVFQHFFNQGKSILLSISTNKKLCKLLEKINATMYNMQSFNSEVRGLGTTAI